MCSKHVTGKCCTKENDSSKKSITLRDNLSHCQEPNEDNLFHHIKISSCSHTEADIGSRTTNEESSAALLKQNSDSTVASSIMKLYACIANDDNSKNSNDA